MYKQFHMYASIHCSVDIYTKELLFCFEIDFYRKQTHWLCSFPLKSEKGSMADKFGTFATHAAVALFMTALIPTAGQKNHSTHSHVYIF